MSMQKSMASDFGYDGLENFLGRSQLGGLQQHLALIGSSAKEAYPVGSGRLALTSGVGTSQLAPGVGGGQLALAGGVGVDEQALEVLGGLAGGVAPQAPEVGGGQLALAGGVVPKASVVGGDQPALAGGVVPKASVVGVVADKNTAAAMIARMQTMRPKTGKKGPGKGPKAKKGRKVAPKASPKAAPKGPKAKAKAKAKAKGTHHKRSIAVESSVSHVLARTGLDKSPKSKGFPYKGPAGIKRAKVLAEAWLKSMGV